MKRTLLYPAILCSLALVLALALPQSASAGCQGKCETIGHHCKACVDQGVFTGAACDEPSPCFCIYVQCKGAQAVAEVDWSDVLPSEPLLPEVAASPAPCSEPGEVSETVEATVET